jgi:hypothetical protein
MDSNAKSRVWYSDTNDSRGESLNDFIAQHNLILLNDNEFINTFHTTRGESSIDMTLITLNLANFVHNWRVLETESMSDHRYIRFDISVNIQQIKYKNTYEYNTKNADFTNFNNSAEIFLQILMQKLEQINSVNDLNLFVNHFISKLTDICDNTLPKRKENQQMRANSWWTQELADLRQKTNSARRRFQRCQTSRRLQLQTEYSQIKGDYKRRLN